MTIKEDLISIHQLMKDTLFDSNKKLELDYNVEWYKGNIHALNYAVELIGYVIEWHKEEK